MDYNKIARDILTHVGGADNVQNMVHCFTRLRFTLKDRKKADKNTIEHLEGVIQVVESGGLFQVVVGTKVTKIYEAMMPMLNLDNNSADAAPQGNIWNRILAAVAAIFTPTVPAIAASGLIKGVLTIIRIMASNRGLDVTGNDTYIILLAATDAVFYFMPLILAYTCAKVFKANKIIAMCLGGALCYPTIVELMAGEEAVHLFGIKITQATYTSSVIPIIIAIFILAYLQKFLEKIVPEVLQIILVPGLSIFIMVPATFMVFGPIGIYIGNAINWVYTSLMAISPILCGAFIGGLWCVFVIFGAHRALLPIGINDVALNGRQNLLAFAGAANFSQGGAALGVMLKTKSKEFKTVSASAFISATVCGITEPAIYGCNLRLKKPMVCAVICGTIGGAIMGAGGVYGDAFANNGVLTIATYAAFGVTKFIFYLVGIGVAFFGAAILTYVVGFEDIVDNNSNTAAAIPAASVPEVTEKEADIRITSPIEGTTVPMSSVRDEVFSSEALGKGIAIVPEKGVVTAPCDCTVAVLYPTLHALGLLLDNGVELLIHIGMDTVNLEGQYFEKYVEQGMKVKKGTKLVGFDIEKIKKAGYDVTVPVVVSNTSDFAAVSGAAGKKATSSTNIIFAKK